MKKPLEILQAITERFTLQYDRALNGYKCPLFGRFAPLPSAVANAQQVSARRQPHYGDKSNHIRMGWL